MTIKGCLYRTTPVLKQFLTAENGPVTIGPKMAVFRKFMGLYVKYSYRNPKGHFLTRSDVFWRKNPCRGVGCSFIEEPPPKKKNEEKKL